MAHRHVSSIAQGDPLLPYLFVIGMKALSSLINKAVTGRFLIGCWVKGKGEDEAQITHLMFTDVCIL